MPVVQLRGRHLLSMKDLSQAEILAILDTADDLKARRAKWHAAAPLAGQTLAMLFQKPSLRTRVSFETGMTRLGGHAIYLSPVDFKLGERESVEDVSQVLSRYADVIMARVFGHNIVTDLAKHSRVPVINGLSDFEHPCQILADLQTIREHKRKLRGLTLAYIGDGNNVAHSLMYGCAGVGMNCVIAAPEGYTPDATVLVEAQVLARKNGAEVRVVHAPEEGAVGADVLYTDVWASMGQEAEAELRRQKFRGFQINTALLARANPGCLVMHCLPAHYGDEITYDVSRMPNAVIFDEAENRMHAQNALMVHLLGVAQAGARKTSKPTRATRTKPTAKATAKKVTRRKVAKRRR